MQAFLNFCKFFEKKQWLIFLLLMHWIGVQDGLKHSLHIISFSYVLTVKTLLLTKIKASIKDYKQQLERVKSDFPHPPDLSEGLKFQCMAYSTWAEHFKIN